MTYRLDAHVAIDYMRLYSDGGKLPIMEQTMDGEARLSLWEQYGVFRGCEELAGRIANEIRNNVRKVDAFVTDVNEVPFIKHIKIQFQGSFNDESGALAGFAPNDSQVKDGVFEMLVFNVVRGAVKRFNRLIVGIMHELTHAYQDYGFIQKGRRLSDENTKSGYHKTMMARPSNELEEEVRDFLYRFNRYEAGAYATDFKGSLPHVKGKRFHTLEDVVKYLHSVPAYRDYEELGEKLWHYNQIDKIPERYKFIILQAANDYSNYNFETLDEFVSWMNYRYDKIMRKFEEIIPKIACEYLQVGGVFI